MISRWLRRMLTMVLCGAPLAAHADDYSEFRIPAHHVMRWDGTLTSSGNRSSPSIDEDRRTDRSIQGQAGSTFSWLSDSDPHTSEIFLRAVANANGNWQSDDFSAFGFAQSQAYEARYGQELWEVFLSHSAYPWARPLGFAVSVDARGSYSQVWQTLDQRADDLVTGNSTVQGQTTEIWFYQTAISSVVALRFGRVRDATGIYDARVLEKRLRDEGALSRPLSSEARRRLADLMFVRYDYDAFRERPGKSLWARVEEILREDGAVSDSGFDAHAVQRAGESEVGQGLSGDGLPRSPVLRQTGGYLAPEIRDRHQSTIQRLDESLFSQQTVAGVPQPPSTSNFSSRAEFPFDEVMAGGIARFSRPLGDRWQLEASGEVLAPLREQDDGFEVNSNGAVTMVISDRWFARASWFQTRSVRQDAATGVTRQDQSDVSYGASLSWYLEDHLQLVAGAADDQFHQRGVNNYSQRSQQFTFALTYRFMGSFAAPGLMPAENLRGPR